ncbi:DUF3347 domain-containing protein [Psychroflexus salinarum]|uniref:DUF3347 domain-containing protein n=1 Tax=Psychroflexus salinarum TaxID=546024 RepID=A0ABW3GPJ1_9FLAO
MKNLNMILSRTVLIGLMTLIIACVDKKKENNTDAEHLHDQEMHDEQMDHDHDAGMNHDGEMQGDVEHEYENHNMAEMSDMTVTKSKTASSLIDNYLAIKNALADDDKDAAAKAGESLVQSANAFDMSRVETSQQQEMKEILEVMKEHGEHISKNDMAHQREHFAQINRDMKAMLAITGSDRMLYEQYCPMYADNKGGAWLSASKDIKNPLFGSQMLNCGAVKQTISLN